MKPRPVFVYAVLLAALFLACVASTGEPPPGLPDWLIVLVGAGLPWLFATFIGKLPQIVRMPVAYLLCGIVAVGCGFAFLGWKTAADVFRALPWVWLAMQFFYDVMVKPARRAIDRRRKRKLL